MASLLDVNFDEVTELEAVPDGEYKVRIIDAKVGFGQNSGNPYFMVQLDIPAETSARDFNHLIMIPVEGMEAKKAQNKFRAFKYFAKAFGLDVNALWADISAIADSGTAGPLPDLVGLEAWAMLGTEEDEQYGPKNRIKRFV